MITEFGKEIRKLRIDAEIKTSDMAKALDITSSYISAVETGKKKLTDSFVDKAVDFFASKGIDSQHLYSAAALSKDEFVISNVGNKDRELVAAFARKFSVLDEDIKEKVSQLLETK